MTYREVFSKLQADLMKLDPNEPTMVSYNSESHTLQFNQLNKVIIASYLSPYFFPKKGFKFGILNQRGLNTLLYELQKLLANNLIDDYVYVPDIVELGTNWYRFYGEGLNLPTKAISLCYCNITNRLYVWFTCMHYNDNTRTLYKLATRR